MMRHGVIRPHRNIVRLLAEEFPAALGRGELVQTLVDRVTSAAEAAAAIECDQELRRFAQPNRLIRADRHLAVIVDREVDRLVRHVANRDAGAVVVVADHHGLRIGRAAVVGVPTVVAPVTVITAPAIGVAVTIAAVRIAAVRAVATAVPAAGRSGIDAAGANADAEPGTADASAAGANARARAGADIHTGPARADIGAATEAAAAADVYTAAADTNA